MATRTWFGSAIRVPQVDTITVANTWAQNDTVELTINSKTIVVTIGTLVTTAQVAATVQQVLAGEALTDTAATYTALGTQVGEFAGLTATVSGSVVTITGAENGRPFTLGVTETTAGSGTATEATATSPTGPHHFNNVDNWSGNTVPVDADDIVFDRGSASLLFSLDTGIQPTSVTRKPTYKGYIGLPKINNDAGQEDLQYDEYLETALTFADDGGATVTTINIEDDGGRTNIDLADCSVATVNVRGNTQRADADVPSLLLQNSATTMVLNVQKGDVGVAFYAGETGHLATWRTGYLTSVESDSLVHCGSGVDLANAAIEISGGQVTIDSATGSGTIDMNGGTLTILSGAHADIDLEAGTLIYRSTDAIAALKLGDESIVDFSKDERPRTVTACEAYGNVTILDPNKTVTWSDGINFNHVNPKSSTFDFGHNIKLTPAAVS
jgi:trimeric autotransporter adhesin